MNSSQMAYSLWKKATVIITNRFLLGLVLGTAAVVPLAISQPAQSQTAASKTQGRQGIMAAYKVQEQALLNGNVSRFMTTLAPDYTAYSLNGSTMNYAQSEIMMRNVIEKSVLGVPVKYQKAKTKILSITWRGPEAIVMSESTVVAVASQGGRTGRSEGVSLSRDYWTPTRTGWKIRQSVTRKMSMWINGVKVS